MTRIPARAVGLSLGIALALGLALATAVSAPDAGLGAPQTTASPAKVIQLKRVAKLNGQFVSLSKRVRRCPAAAADLRAATAQRAKANRSASRANVAKLKAKRRTLSSAVARLSRAAKRCAVTAGGGSLTRVISSGAGGAGGPLTFSADVRLPDLIGGSILDLSRVLSSGIRPSDVIVVDVGDLTSAECRWARWSASALTPPPSAVRSTRCSAPTSSWATCWTSTSACSGSQIDDLLAVGDLDSLLSVVPLGDGLFQLVPQGPLAELAGLADVPNVVIGALRLA